MYLIMKVGLIAEIRVRYLQYFLFCDVSGFVIVIFIVYNAYMQYERQCLGLPCGRFTFELDADHKVEMMPTLTTKAKYGIKLIFTERNNW